MRQNVALCGNGLTLYHTIPTFNDLKKENFENIVGKEENIGYQHFIPFPQCFIPFPKQNSVFWDTFMLQSTNAFNLE